MTTSLDTPATPRAADGRRLRLSPDLAWLLAEIGPGASIAELAARLAERTGRPVAAADARALVVTTLVANGLARLGRNDRVTRVEAPGAEAVTPGANAPGPGAAHSRELRVLAALVSESATTRLARTFARLGSPLAVALAGSIGLVAATAAVAARAAAPEAWLDPVGWAAAVVALAVTVLAHEWGHAVAFARAGGAPGPIAIARLGSAPVLMCGIPGITEFPARARMLVSLAGPAWQLGAGAVLLVVLAAARVSIPAPLAAALLASPLLALVPLRHHDGDALAAALAGAADGTGLAWSPLPAAGRSRVPIVAHGLALAIAIGTALVWLVVRFAPEALRLARGEGGAAWVVFAGAVLASAACAWVAGSLVARTFRWSAPDAARRRNAPLARYAANAWEHAKLAAAMAAGRGGTQDALQLVPLMLSLSFPERRASELRRAAIRHAAGTVVTRRDHAELGRGGLADEIRHATAVQSLIRSKQGAIVCSMHLGPFYYVSLALGELGAPQTVFTAGGVQRTGAEGWAKRAAGFGTSFETVLAGTPRAALRALKALDEGRLLVVYMDGQHGAGGRPDQHRADFRFCGTDFYMRTGPAFLAQRAGVPIILGACWRQGLARRIAEFSDPLPPPDGPDDASLVARTAEMYRWFEPRVQAHPEQWPGWLYPILHWRESGSAPTVTRVEWEAAVARAAELLATGSSAKLVADATRAGWVELGEEILLVHGPTHRVLQGSPVQKALLSAAQRGTRVRDLPRAAGAPPDVLAAEVARLTLAGLAELRG